MAKPSQCVEKVRLRRPFPRVERCFPLVPAGLPGGKQRKETLLRKLAHPPHMSPDADYIWRASALQTSRKGFLTVCDGRAIFQPCIAVGEGHTMVSGFSQRSYKAVIQENLYFNIHFLLMIE